MRIATIVCGLVVASAVITASAKEEKEQKIPLADCPKAVQTTLQQEVGDGRIVDIDKEKSQGQTVYVTEVRYGKLEYDIIIDGEGTLLSKALEGPDEDEGQTADKKAPRRGKRQKLSKKTDLPKKVLKTLVIAAGKGRIEELAKRGSGSKAVYEAEVELGDRDYVIAITQDGTLLSKKLESDDEDEQEEHEGQEAKESKADHDDDGP